MHYIKAPKKNFDKITKKFYYFYLHFYTQIFFQTATANLHLASQLSSGPLPTLSCLYTCRITLADQMIQRNHLQPAFDHEPLSSNLSTSLVGNIAQRPPSPCASDPSLCGTADFLTIIQGSSTAHSSGLVWLSFLWFPLALNCSSPLCSDVTLSTLSP